MLVPEKQAVEEAALALLAHPVAPQEDHRSQGLVDPFRMQVLEGQRGCSTDLGSRSAKSSSD